MIHNEIIADAFDNGINDDNINDYRWDMTSILIIINNNDAMPDLSIFTNMSREGKSKMLLPTLNDKLKLYGLVRWPASDLMSTIARGRGVNITWSIDGLSASDLSSIALTGSEYKLIFSIGCPGFIFPDFYALF